MSKNVDRVVKFFRLAGLHQSCSVMLIPLLNTREFLTKFPSFLRWSGLKFDILLVATLKMYKINVKQRNKKARNGLRQQYQWLCWVVETHNWPPGARLGHYNDVTMGAMAAIVYSTVYSGADQRKHQSSVSLAFVRGIHRWPVNSTHKWPVTRKMFPFDDVIMVQKLPRTNEMNEITIFQWRNSAQMVSATDILSSMSSLTASCLFI